LLYKETTLYNINTGADEPYITPSFAEPFFSEEDKSAATTTPTAL
jgi:hypothetical protein